jgi:signal peptidase I
MSKNDSKLSLDPLESGHENNGFFSYENLKSLAILIPLVFALRWSVASLYHVPTSSMEPTIKVGDRLLALKLAYNFKLPFTDIVLFDYGEVKHGDIIVFRYPKEPGTDYVKRVIGIPGDEIRIEDDIIYVNDEPRERVDHNFDRSILDDIHDPKDKKLLYQEELSEQKYWVMQNIQSERWYTKTKWPPSGLSPYKVPKDSVFVMGDNRDNSTDSRVWGEVPMSYIRGKAMFVVWSLYTPTGEMWPKLRFSRFGHSLQ